MNFFEYQNQLMKKLYGFILLFIFTSNMAFSQLSTDEIPYSFHLYKTQQEAPLIKIQAPDISNKEAESQKKGRDIIGEIVPLNLNTKNHGAWQQNPDKSWLWQLRIHSEGAHALMLYFDRFSLPESAKLFLFSKDKRFTYGAFTSESSTADKEFALTYVPGNEFTVELWVSEFERSQVFLQFDELGYLFRHIPEFTEYPETEVNDFGDAGSCMVNVNCPEGVGWGNQKSSVLRVLVRDGGFNFWCTGATINTADYVCKPYFLTADHCASTASESDFNQFIFFFNYEGPSCSNPSNDNNINNQRLTGCKKIAKGFSQGDEDSDMLLLLLNSNIPENYFGYYAGWSRANSTSSGGVSIHHPNGDIKKISTYSAPLTLDSYGGVVQNTHLRVMWRETTSGHSVTEQGSSGSPIFNADGLIIGTLTGGSSSCNQRTSPDFYGRFYYHWDKISSNANHQLKPWLDSTNTQNLEVMGVSVSECEIVGVPKVSGDIKYSLIYPNPGNSSFQVERKAFNEAAASLGMFDVSGKLIFTRQLNSEKELIDASDVPAGIYFIKIEGRNYLETHKWIKK